MSLSRSYRIDYDGWPDEILGHSEADLSIQGCLVQGFGLVPPGMPGSIIWATEGGKYLIATVHGGVIHGVAGQSLLSLEGCASNTLEVVKLQYFRSSLQIPDDPELVLALKFHVHRPGEVPLSDVPSQFVSLADACVFLDAAEPVTDWGYGVYLENLRRSGHWLGSPWKNLIYPENLAGWYE